MNRLIKNTATISVLTLLSRILGVIRDAGIAMVFGTSLHTDAFFLAFKPFDLVRKLFSEGILSISFIPEFSRVISEKGRNEAVIMAMSFLGFLSLTAAVIILLAFIFSGSAVALIAPGFASGSSAAALTETLFVIMLPYLWCTMIIALCMGVLNTLGHFVIPALAPVLFNATIISFTLLACNYFDLPVTGLAAGVFAGGCVQVLIQIPVMWRYKMFNLKSFRLFHPSLIRVFKIMIPTMIGAASFQINIMVASFFASQLKEGSVSFIYFADRLVQFPLALFAVSVSTVLLPDFAHKASTNKLEQIAPLFTKGVRLVFYITFPAMAGLMALDQEIVRFLFGQGRFDTYAVNQTASCLFWLVTAFTAALNSSIKMLNMKTWSSLSGYAATGHFTVCLYIRLIPGKRDIRNGTGLLSN